MISLTVNGVAHSYDGDGDMPLLWYLRDELGLLGTKFGCGQALCGSCTVHLDAAAIRSCQTPMTAVANAKLVTIEGLSPNGMHPLQIAWREADSHVLMTGPTATAFQGTTDLSTYPA